VRLLTVDEVLLIHERVIATSGGSHGLRDRGVLESCVAQPMQSFGETELYPDLVSKAAALGFFLVSNHPFVDGNKRIAHAAIAVTHRLNGSRIAASIDDQEALMIEAASGTLDREAFTGWFQSHVTGM